VSYPRADLTGQRFGRLVAIEPGPRHLGRGESQWSCRCDCGSAHVVLTNSLVSNYTRSCGCLRREVAATNCRRRAGKSVAP
jgi:hypothetical protein